MAVRVLIPIPFDFVVLCRRRAPVPLACMYIDVHTTPSFMHPRRFEERDYGCIKSVAFEYM